MIDVKQAAKSLGRLAILKYFPADEVARTEILALVCEMATTNEQIDWLVGRARSVWNEWEGPRELRALLCSKFRPADGIEVYSSLPQFADGIPSERPEQNALPPASTRQITGTVSAAPSLNSTLSDLVRAKDMNRAIKGIRPPKVREIPVVQITDKNRITQADIDRAAEELHQRQAQEAIGQKVTA